MSVFQRGNRKASRLTGEQVLKIRALYQMRGVTQGSLARQFQVSVNTIANIVNGLTWQSLGAGEVNRPPPHADPAVPSNEQIAASLARFQKLTEGHVERPAPSLYESPPPTADHELSDSAAEKFSKALTLAAKPSVSEELDGLIK
jgi:DNA-binding XRE family transcriptional regulator